MQRQTGVEDLSRGTPVDFAGPVDFPDTERVEHYDLLPGGREAGGEDHSIASRIRVSSSSDSSRGLPLMLFPRESRTIAGICSGLTPNSESRPGIFSSIRSV